jgi:hypothetical protein
LNVLIGATIVESERDLPSGNRNLQKFAHIYVLSAHYIALHKVNKANIVGRKYIKVSKFLQISIATWYISPRFNNRIRHGLNFAPTNQKNHESKLGLQNIPRNNCSSKNYLCYLNSKQTSVAH